MIIIYLFSVFFNTVFRNLKIPVTKLILDSKYNEYLNLEQVIYLISSDKK